MIARDLVGVRAERDYAHHHSGAVLEMGDGAAGEFVANGCVILGSARGPRADFGGSPK
jgi:hypothetical protein